MEWIKFFIESLIQLIRYTAWPIVVLLVLLIFRLPLVGLLRRLRKLGTEKAFAEFIDPALHEEATKGTDISKVTKENIKWDDYLGALEQWALWASFYGSMLHSESKFRPLGKMEKDMADVAVWNAKLVVKLLEKAGRKNDLFEGIKKVLADFDKK